MTENNYANSERRGVFGADVANYEAARPGYPSALYDTLRQVCGIGSGSRVLEIGPGPGQATKELLALGASLVGVEIDSRMADRLVERFGTGRLRTIVRAFEDVSVPELVGDGAESFDLVAAGTSFHWVPTEVGLARAADVLGEGGWLALWWNCYFDPDRPDPFSLAIEPLMERLAPQLLDIGSAGRRSGAGSPYALDCGARTAEIDASGRFGEVEHHLFSWTGVHSATEIRSLFASYSPWIALDASVRNALLDEFEALARCEFDDRVERPYVTSLFLAPVRAQLVGEMNACQ